MNLKKILAGLIVGIFFGYILQISPNEKICAVIMIAAIDSLFGGFVAKLNSNFSDKILIGGFFTNATFGLILILLGNFFKIDLYYIALFIFGLRIYKNIFTLKEFFLKKYLT